MGRYKSSGSAIWLSDIPATDLQRRRSLILMTIMLAGFVAVTPFATVRLPGNSGFIPIIQAILFIADLITAVLIYTMYFVVHSRALLVLATGYLFSAIFLVPHTLTFPNVFAPEGLLGPALQTTAWLYVISHFAFPASVIGYAILSDKTTSEKKPQSFNLSGIICSVAIVIALVCIVTWSLLAAENNLPRLFLDRRTFAPLVPYVALLDAFVCGVALFLLWFRERSVLGQWLAIAMFATLLEQVMQLFIAGRFDVGWYSVRIFGLIASTVVLLVLLAETTNLYAKLVLTLHALEHERAVRLMSVEAATAAIAHEVKQPLTALVSNAEASLLFLKHTPLNRKELRASLDSIIAAGLRMDEIILSIRKLYKNTSSERTMVDVNNTIRQVLGLIGNDLQAAHVSIATDFQENLPPINANATQFQEIILNLVRNAMDAMASVPPSSKQLWLQTKVDVGKSHVSFLVGDSGLGIVPEHRDRIFEPFFTTKPTGTGLGLSLCRIIVEDHGGHLRLVKTDTHGSTFEGAMPVA